MATNYTKTLSNPPDDPLVIPEELFKSGDITSIKSVSLKAIIKYYAAQNRVMSTNTLGQGRGWNDTFARLTESEMTTNVEKNKLSTSSTDWVEFDQMDYYHIIEHMNGTMAHRFGDIEYKSNEQIGCLFQIRKLLKLMDPNAEPIREQVVQKHLPGGRYQFAPTYNLDRPNDIEDDDIRALAKSAVRLHNAYFEKDHEMRLLFDWGNNCHPPCLEWQHYGLFTWSASYQRLRSRGESITNLSPYSIRSNLNRNIDYFQSKYEPICHDLQQIIGWAASLYQHLTSHYGKKLYVTERLIQDQGIEVLKRANGDLEVRVSDPSAAMAVSWSYFANADGDIPEFGLENVTRLGWFPDDEHKHIAAKTMKSDPSVIETLSDVIGLSVADRTKFLRDEFGMTKHQVYLLSKYMTDAYNEAINKTGDGLVLIKTGDVYHPHDTSGLHNIEIVQQADLDKLYEVVSKLDAGNVTLGTENPENQWMLGFSDFYGAWITLPSRTTTDKLAEGFGSPAYFTIPGMVEYTANDGEVWCSFNYGRGKDWWFPKKELPCGDRGRIWFDKKLKAYVFVWFYRNPDGSLDSERNKPYFRDWSHAGWAGPGPGPTGWDENNPRRVPPVGQLIDLHKFPYSGSGIVWGYNVHEPILDNE